MKNLAFALLGLLISGYWLIDAAAHHAVGDMVGWGALWVLAFVTLCGCWCKERWCLRPRCMHEGMRSSYCRKHLNQLRAIWWISATLEERRRAREVETGNSSQVKP